jgi:hypothetical protein
MGTISLRDTEAYASNLFYSFQRYITAEEDRGKVWQTLLSARSGDMWYSMRRLTDQIAGTVRDQSSGTDSISQEASEGSYHPKFSGIGFRFISEAGRNQWQYESKWDNVYMHSIRVAEDYNFADQRDLRIPVSENINTFWLRTIRNWSRVDGNVISLQILWAGKFSDSRRVLRFLQDVNTPNFMETITQQFSLHLHLREQYIAGYETNPVAAALSAVDCSPTVMITHEIVATRGADSDGDLEGLLCSICQDVISLGERAKQLPCNHLFHRICIVRWLGRRFTCPLCRYQLSLRAPA